MRIGGISLNPDILAFQKSISKEIKTLKNRVRDLIGGIHWGEEGRYKESIVKTVINRFLPQQLSIGTGFIISEQNGRILRSSQIDIIIYDNTFPLLFKEGDFIITTPQNVLGTVEIKTSLVNKKIKEVIQKASENASMAINSKFNGLFVFEKRQIGIKEGNINNNLEEALKESAGKVNHICIGENIFIKFWNSGSDPKGNISPIYRFYGIEELAFSYFISNLIEKIAPTKVQDKPWFLYPIESANGKEDFEMDTLIID